MKQLLVVISLYLVFQSFVAFAGKMNKYHRWSAQSDGTTKYKRCWIYSEPIKAKGDYKRRGKIYALVTHMPRENVFDQVQFVAGYKFRKDSDVKVRIGRNEFKLFTAGDAAWLGKAEDETRLVKAMRAGSEMIVSGVSSRGTTTIDTYSLKGFTAAHKKITKKCQKK